MRITKKAVFDMESGRLLEWEGYEYQGPLELCGGGPSASQKRAAAQTERTAAEQLALARQMNAREQEQYDAIKPYAFSRLQGGLPFFGALTDYGSGTNARAFAPAKTALLQRLGSFQGLPSGFREQALSDFDAARARGFDENLTQALFANEQAKSEAARLLTGQQQIANPLGYFGGAQQGYNNILQAQSLVRPGIAGLLGGLANTALRKVNLGTGFPSIGG
jgi:hypothetical protein